MVLRRTLSSSSHFVKLVFVVSALKMREVRQREAVAIGLGTQKVAAVIQTQDRPTPKLMFPMTAIHWPLHFSCPRLFVHFLSFNRKVSSTYHVPDSRYPLKLRATLLSRKIKLTVGWDVQKVGCCYY